MSPLWESETELLQSSPGCIGWILGGLRAFVLALVVFGSLFVLLLVRGVEKPFFGLHRPFTPFITQGVCRVALMILGIRFSAVGKRMAHKGAVVANHTSWLDIFALNAKKRIYFVSKSEVAAWPGIGWLAKATGTVFIKRERKDAKQQQEVFEDRLLAGHKLLFFPEGTSTDGMRVLPFKSSLFQAFFSPHLVHEMYIQPVTAIYTAPNGQDPRFYGWWGDMGFSNHLVKTLTAVRQGAVTVVYHPPVRVDDFSNRKNLALYVENVVRSAMPTDHQSSI